MVTLTGNNFSPQGYAVAGSSESGSSSAYLKSATWISSTQVDLVVKGRTFEAPGEIWFGYQNPSQGSYLDWGRAASNRLRVPVLAPAVSCPLPTVFTSLADGCECSADFDPGDGLHTYAMTCTTECACKRDGVAVATVPRGFACYNEWWATDQWKSSCLTTAAFCP